MRHDLTKTEIEQAICQSLPAAVLEVLSTLEENGYPAFVVGGCLRDMIEALLGEYGGTTRQAHDFDIASAARPDQLPEVFSNKRLIDTGLRYGTVTLLTAGQSLEITTFRAESGYSDYRHPDQVSFTSDIAADLSRRDFTVNAMAYSPLHGLVDPFAGLADLQAGLLRAVGSPDERLKEDALRIIRALRFAATLGYDIEAGLEDAIRRYKGLLARVSAERIQAELMRLLPGRDVLSVLLGFGEVFAVFVPEIAAAQSFDQKSPWHDYDVWEHSARALAAASNRDPLVRLALLFHDLGKPAAFSTDQTGRGHFNGHAQIGAEIARRCLTELRFDRRTIAAVPALIENHLVTLQPDNILSWLRRLGEPQLRRLIEVKEGDMSAHAENIADDRVRHLEDCLAALDAALAAGACYTLAQLAVSGDDLIGLGYPPGPALGAKLEQLLDAVVEGRLPNERQALLAALQSGEELGADLDG